MTYDSTASYPRDLAGYGRNPPHAQWPGGARIAVQFVLNYEEGGENSRTARRRRLGAIPVRDVQPRRAFRRGT